MSPCRKPAAVVIGLDSVTGLQTARLLAAQSVPVVGVAANTRHPGCRTRACARVVHSATTDERLIDALAAEAAALDAPAVLFPCTDLSVLMVARHRERLEGLYHTVLPPPGVTELLLDKARFLAHAAAADVPVAATHVLRDRGDADRAAAALAFPCVLKPAVKTSEWQARTSAKVFKASTRASFLAHYDRCRAWTDVLIAQEWIEGPDTQHVTCNGYFDSESRMVAAFVSRKLRQWPLEGGVGCLSEACRNDEVLRFTARLFGTAGHRGLAYLETKRDRRTGRLVVIEPNVGRPTGRSAAADRAGIPLVYTHYCDALGWPLPSAADPPERGATWIYLRQDCQSAVRQWQRGTLGLAEWLRSLKGVRGDAMFSWHDPAPFLADLAAGVAKAFAGDRHPTHVAPSRDRALHEPSLTRVPRVASDAYTGEDFDVHGVVGVRVVGGTAVDVAVVARQLGPLQAPLHGDPDIVVRFVDELPVPDLQWVEYGRTGFTEDAFYVVQSGKRPARVRLALHTIGGDRCEIVCQRGLRSVPYLMAIVNLTAVARGWVPLHASAFIHGGTGVLVTGWAKGGKTEALLAFAAQGARYVGDEWLLLSGTGDRMAGVPEVIRLQDWHLQQLPAARRRVSMARHSFFRGIRAIDRCHRAVSGTWLRRTAVMKAVGDALPPLRRQLNVQLDPMAVFPRRAPAFESRPDKVFLMMSHDAPAITVQPADAQEVAQRMSASIAYEQLPLTSAYLAYRFAFPERRSPWFERLQTVQSERLSQALSGRETYVVRHPYPCNLRELYEIMAPFCDAAPAAGQRSERVAEPRGERRIHGDPVHV